jgi:flagellin
MTFQIGANGTGDQQVNLSVTNMGVWTLGDRAMTSADVDASGESTTMLSGNMVAHVDISTRSRANDSIRVLDAAINQVSGTRADLGAMQNRLEHTINNLGVAKENLQSAESSIRDVDMAKEMMEFTKNNILTQASQSMLAQANQLPSGVLQLLR